MNNYCVTLEVIGGNLYANVQANSVEEATVKAREFVGCFGVDTCGMEGDIETQVEDISLDNE